jgi:hypothetical protein
VYADWLEEHGQTDRAEFIRVQCRLARPSPTDDICDLLERETELTTVAADEIEADWPALPDGWHRGAVRRGFPDGVILQGRYVNPVAGEMPQQLEAVAGAMPLTACELAFSPGPGRDILRDPVAERLRGLHLSTGSLAHDADLFDILQTSPHLRNLRHLSVSVGRAGGSDDLVRLLNAKSLPHLRSLDFSFNLSPPERPVFADAVLQEQLVALDTGLTCFGRYHHLAAGCAFPALRRLKYFGALTTHQTALLNNPSLYPALVELDIYGASNWAGTPGVLERPLQAVRRDTPYYDPGLETFLSSPALRTVRRLALADGGAIGDGWPERLARPGVFDDLRHLDLEKMRCSPAGLSMLAAAPFWQTVTSCRLHRPFGRVGTDDWAAFFRALHAPALRHLTLHGVDLKSRGGLALAGNRSLNNLRLLRISEAKLGKKAVRAILTAPHFQNLLVLSLPDNEGREGFDPLTDPGVMPHARAINLGDVKLPPTVIQKLRDRPGVKFKRR